MALQSERGGLRFPDESWCLFLFTVRLSESTSTLYFHKTASCKKDKRLADRVVVAQGSLPELERVQCSILVFKRESGPRVTTWVIPNPSQGLTAVAYSCVPGSEPGACHP